MTSAEGAELLELWLLQVVWGLGPWLCVGLGLVVILRGSRAFRSAGRSIEARAERTARRGQLAIGFDLVSHRVLTLLSGLFAFACLAVAGLLSGGLQKGVEPLVHERVPPLEIAPVEPVSVDFIAAVCLATLGATLAIVVLVYRTLRRRVDRAASADPAARPTAAARFSARPLAVRLGVSAFGGFLLCGLLSQIVWGMMLIFPPPTSWRTLEAPGLLPALAWVLLCLGPALLIAALSPTWSLVAAGARLNQRFLELSPEMRLRYARRFAIAAGFIGAAIDFYLLVWIAARLFPGLFSVPG